jgi:hypothetical protein
LASAWLPAPWARDTKALAPIPTSITSMETSQVTYAATPTADVAVALICPARNTSTSPTSVLRICSVNTGRARKKSVLRGGPVRMRAVLADTLCKETESSGYAQRVKTRRSSQGERHGRNFDDGYT